MGLPLERRARCGPRQPPPELPLGQLRFSFGCPPVVGVVFCASPRSAAEGACVFCVLPAAGGSPGLQRLFNLALHQRLRLAPAGGGKGGAGGGAVYLPQRPGGVGAHQRLRLALQHCCQQRDVLRVAPVAQRHRHVAQVAAPFGAGEGRPGAAPAEVFGGEGQLAAQVGRGRETRGKERVEGLARAAAVPRANLLADVAAENPVAQFGAQVAGDDPLVFNREVGNTAGGRGGCSRSGRLGYSGGRCRSGRMGKARQGAVRH